MCPFLYIFDPTALILMTLWFLAGVINGNSDQIAQDTPDNLTDDPIWLYILKGKVLKWFRGDYTRKLKGMRLAHPITYDGWHFFKNLKVLVLLIAVTFALVFGDFQKAPEEQLGYAMAYFLLFAFAWWVGKGLMHLRMASYYWWTGKIGAAPKV